MPKVISKRKTTEDLREIVAEYQREISRLNVLIGNLEEIGAEEVEVTRLFSAVKGLDCFSSFVDGINKTFRDERLKHVPEKEDDLGE